MSLKDTDKKRVIYSKSDNIEIMILSRYQIGLEKSMKGSVCDFDFVDLLYCKCHKIN